MGKKEDKDSLFCSFCGKSQKEVKKLIAGPTVFVCDECVELCMDIIKEDNKNNKKKLKTSTPKPSEINKFLDNNKQNPFILYAGFFEPHPPYSGPLNKKYNTANLSTPPHFLKKPDSNASYINQITAEYYSSLEEYDGSPISTTKDWKQLRANYYGNVSLIDQAIGNILGVFASNPDAIFGQQYAKPAS